MAYHILSLDGGGIRGLFQAEYLAELAKTLPKPLHECFDMLAGTSTGSIVAMGVANGVHPKQIASVFKEDGPKIFEKGWSIPGVSSVLGSGPKYKTEPLRSALDSVIGGRKLNDCLCDAVVTAVTLNTYECKVFSNVFRTNKSDLDLLATEVALCSSAAPTYFAAVSPEGSHRTFVDGGLYANDPSIVAALMAHREKGIGYDDMRIVRLGNGRVQGGMQEEEYNELSELNTIGPILEMMFECQSDWNEIVLRGIVPEDQLVRINPELAEFVELDDPEAAQKVLPARAEEEFRRSGLEVRKLLGLAGESEDGGMSDVCGAAAPE